MLRPDGWPEGSAAHRERSRTEGSGVAFALATPALGNHAVKLATTPASDVELDGGDCAPLPIPRFAKPCQARGSSSGPRFCTASMKASRACVNVGFDGVSFSPATRYSSI